MNKKKRVASGDPVSEFQGEDLVSSGVHQDVSFRESLLGSDSMHVEGDFEDGFTLDDDETEQEMDPDCPTIYLTKKENAAYRRPWRQSLIIKVMGKGVGFMYLLNRIKSLWKPKVDIEMISLENDYFLVKFTSLMDYQFAAFEGPCMVLDHYLIVKEWCPNFDPYEDKEEKLLV